MDRRQPKSARVLIYLMNNLDVVLKHVTEAWDEVDCPSDVVAFGFAIENTPDSAGEKIDQSQTVFAGRKWNEVNFEDLILSPNLLSAMTARGASYYLGSYLYLCAKNMQDAANHGRAYTLLIQAFGCVKTLVQSDVMGKRFTASQTRSIAELLSVLGKDYQQFHLEDKAFSRRYL